MQGWAKGWVLALLIAALAMPVVAFSAAQDIAGEWVSVAVDTGEGVMQTEYEGTKVDQLIRISFNENNTLTMTSQGVDTEGTWTEADGSVNTVINGQEVDFDLIDGRLVNDIDGFLIYLEKVKKKGGLLDVLSIGKYAGKWAATGFDIGDGLIVNEIDGNAISDIMSFRFNRDGSMALTSLGEETTGTWVANQTGIDFTIEDRTVGAVVQDDVMIIEIDGQVAYLEREGKVTVTPSPTIEATAQPELETPEPEASGLPEVTP